LPGDPGSYDVITDGSTAWWGLAKANEIRSVSLSDETTRMFKVCPGVQYLALRGVSVVATCTGANAVEVIDLPKRSARQVDAGYMGLASGVASGGV
jgi:hypothetical protein